MISDLPIADAAATSVQTVTVSVPIPVDVPLSDVLVTTWSDFITVCSVLYVAGICLGFAIWEFRHRRIQKRQKAAEQST